MIINASVGLVLIIGLTALLYFIRSRSTIVTHDQVRLARRTKPRNRRVWDELACHPDVRVQRPKYAGVQSAPSYFDHANKQG